MDPSRRLRGRFKIKALGSDDGGYVCRGNRPGQVRITITIKRAKLRAQIRVHSEGVNSQLNVSVLVCMYVPYVCMYVRMYVYYVPYV